MTLQRAALWTVVIAATIFLLVAGRGLLLPFVLGIVLWYMIDSLADTFAQPRLGGLRLPQPIALTLAVMLVGGLFWIVGRTIGLNVQAVVAAGCARPDAQLESRCAGGELGEVLGPHRGLAFLRRHAHLAHDGGEDRFQHAVVIDQRRHLALVVERALHAHRRLQPRDQAPDRGLRRVARIGVQRAHRAPQVNALGDDVVGGAALHHAHRDHGRMQRLDLAAEARHFLGDIDEIEEFLRINCAAPHVFAVDAHHVASVDVQTRASVHKHLKCEVDQVHVLDLGGRFYFNDVPRILAHRVQNIGACQSAIVNKTCLEQRLPCLGGFQ